FIIEISDGALSSASHFQDRMLLMEISALVTLAGAAFAGATSYNGLKQGLCVGVGTCVILAGIYLGNAKAPLEATALSLVSTLILSLAGGWFGGQLFPPVIPKRRQQIHEMF